MLAASHAAHLAPKRVFSVARANVRAGSFCIRIPVVWRYQISSFVAIVEALDSVINANGSGGSTWRFFALAC